MSFCKRKRQKSETEQRCSLYSIGLALEPLFIIQIHTLTSLVLLCGCNCGAALLRRLVQLANKDTLRPPNCLPKQTVWLDCASWLCMSYHSLSSKMTTPIRISKRKLANPIQAPPDLGFNDPVLEAEARKTRYISLSLKELVAGDAPVQIWTTERPTTPLSDNATPTPSETSSTSSSDDGFRLDLGKYLAKIPTSNDRALRSKLDRIGSNTPEDTSTAYKEPDTPSSLPPRNTLPKARSPTYVPPGKRGSRVPAHIDDVQNAIPLVVHAPIPKRSYSSTTAQSLNAVKRNISLRRTASAESTLDSAGIAVPFAAVPPVADATSVAPKRGRPRRVLPEYKAISSRPEKLINTWNSKRVVDSPLVSPSTSSTGTGPASTADESSLVDDEGDEDFEDDEDDSYVPPSPHHKKAQSPPTSTSRKSVKTTQQGKTRKTAKRGSLDLSVSRDAGRSAAPVVSQDLGTACHLAQYPLSTVYQGNPARGLSYFNEKKRTYVDMASSDEASLEQASSRKNKLGRPLTLTLKRSDLSNSSVPRLHSPLSQSFYVGRDESALNVMPAQVHRLVPTLSVS